MKGRPSAYTNELADRICEEISVSDRGLTHICKNNVDFPSVTTIMRWLADEEKVYFREQYTRAREAQADFMIDQMIEISDHNSSDTIHTEKGQHPDNEWINRSRLRVDTRKWILSKLLPKKYGDKVEVDENVTFNIPTIVFRHEPVTGLEAGKG